MMESILTVLKDSFAQSETMACTYPQCDSRLGEQCRPECDPAIQQSAPACASVVSHDWQPDGGVVRFESHQHGEAPHVHTTCSKCGARAWFLEYQWELLAKGCTPSSAGTSITCEGSKAYQVANMEGAPLYVPVCGGHAQTWFTERDHLNGGMDATCIVCAHTPPSATLSITDAEIETLRTNVKGAVSNLWADASARQIVHDKVDAVFAAAARYQVLRTHFWKPILGACFGRYMIAEEKDERLLDYHVDRANKSSPDRYTKP